MWLGETGFMNIATRLPLHDGHSIPQLGFGLYKVEDADAPDVIAAAIEAGYRHFDTATLYLNEAGTGRGLAAASVAREDLFVTTKVWETDQGFDETLRAFDTSMRLLGLDTLDLYLIHWPAPELDRYVDTWRAMIRLRSEGRIVSIGVSNFHARQLKRLTDETGVAPVVNQIELHPWSPQKEMRGVHAEAGIVTESWSPLARGKVLRVPLLAEIAAKHAVTPAQVAIRWNLQLGNVVIPKSATVERIRSNADVYGFELDAADLAAIDTLASDER